MLAKCIPDVSHHLPPTGSRITSICRHAGYNDPPPDPMVFHDSAINFFHQLLHFDPFSI